MKLLMTRWNLEPLYPKPSGRGVPSFLTPVASARKFSAVLGTVYPHLVLDSRTYNHDALHRKGPSQLEGDYKYLEDDTYLRERTTTEVFVAMLDVEIDLVRDFGTTGGINTLCTE